MSELMKIISKINKDHGKELIKIGTGYVEVKKIPFSSPRANYMTYGGVPRGKATEFLGAESGGKTTSAIDIVKNAQILAQQEYDEKIAKIHDKLEALEGKDSKQAEKERKKLTENLEALEEAGPQKVMYIDAENTLDTDWAELNGVRTDLLLLVRPEDETAEEVLQMILDVIDTGEVILVVLDSLPMLVSKALFEENLEKKTYAGIAGVVTEFSRKVSPKLSKTMTALLIINQVREDLNNPYNQYNTPGGRALKHLYALRLFFRKGSFIDENNKELPQKAGEPVGNLVDMTIVKTKVCKPDRRVGFYTLNYHTGIDFLADTADLAIKYGYIIQSGAWFTMIDKSTGEILTDIGDEELKFQGRGKLLEFLRDDEEVFEELSQAIMEEIA